MGWQKIPWYTITDDWDKDFSVDQWHGHNVFFRDENDKIFRTYYINNRGDEAMGSLWSYLDITPLGRQEDWEDSPEGYPKGPRYKWWRWHDVYGGARRRMGQGLGRRHGHAGSVIPQRRSSHAAALIAPQRRFPRAN